MSSIKDRIVISTNNVTNGKEIVRSAINSHGGNVDVNPTFQELADSITNGEVTNYLAMKSFYTDIDNYSSGKISTILPIDDGYYSIYLTSGASSNMYYKISVLSKTKSRTSFTLSNLSGYSHSSGKVDYMYNSYDNKILGYQCYSAVVNESDIYTMVNKEGSFTTRLTKVNTLSKSIVGIIDITLPNKDRYIMDNNLLQGIFYSKYNNSIYINLCNRLSGYTSKSYLYKYSLSTSTLTYIGEESESSSSNIRFLTNIRIDGYGGTIFYDRGSSRYVLVHKYRDRIGSSPSIEPIRFDLETITSTETELPADLVNSHNSSSPRYTSFYTFNSNVILHEYYKGIDNTLTLLHDYSISLPSSNEICSYSGSSSGINPVFTLYEVKLSEDSNTYQTCVLAIKFISLN